MKKKEFIKRQIAKTNRKDYENYVVTRIIHFLDDLEIKFVTQQYVKRPDGYALADLYFPQLNYIVEVDESQHIRNSELDKIRDYDIENAIGVTPKRIDVAQNSINKINELVSETVKEINEKVFELKNKGDWTPWEIEKELSPDYWIKKGEIHLSDKVSFRRSVDACRCMGLNYKGFQRSGANHPYEENTVIWFPKLYPNGVWENSYDDEKGEIKTSKSNQAEQKEYIEERLNDSRKRRIVFARVKDNLGDVKYRFRGVFEMDVSKTNIKNGVVWERISKHTETYDYRNQ